MDFASSMYEIDQIEKEVKTVNDKLRKLRDRKKVLMNSILTYLIENDQDELKVNGKILRLEEKVKKARKKESDKKNDIVNIIKEHFPEAPSDEIYSLIKNSLQGEEKIEYTLGRA